MTLANTFVLLGAVALALTSMFGTAGALANVAVRRAAARYADSGYTWAVQRLRAGIVAQISAGTDPRGPFASLSPAPFCAAQTQTCDFAVDPQIEIEPATLPPSPLACSSGQSCAQNLQSNAYVREARVSAHIVVLVTTADGSLLARRAQFLTLRTFGTPPYVASAGVSDDAGLDGPVSPAPCASPDPSASFTQDTMVGVAYQNAQTGACADGSSWTSQTWQNPAGGS